MDINEADYIFQIIRSSKHKSLSDKLIESAAQYAQIRVNWYFSKLDEKIELDKERTLAHEVLIDSCNALARNMKAAGEDDSWRSSLGNDRKRIGDFACIVHALIGIEAR